MDWTLISFESVIKIIENDFKYFLDEEFLYLKKNIVTNRLYDCQFPHALKKIIGKMIYPKFKLCSREESIVSSKPSTQNHLYFVHVGKSATPALAKKLCSIIEEKCKQNYTIAIIGNNRAYQRYPSNAQIKFYFLNIGHYVYKKPQGTKHIVKDLGLA